MENRRLNQPRMYLYMNEWRRSKSVFQEIRPGATDTIGQMLLLVVARLSVNDEMADCEENLHGDFGDGNFP